MTEPKAIRIITRCDDAGFNENTNEACRLCCVEGLGKNISLMAPAPHIEDAAARLNGLKGIDFGAHITLTCEWNAVRWGPVLGAERVPTLVDSDGFFFKSCHELNDRQPSIEEACAEIHAQCEKLESLGFNLSYLDEHMMPGWIGEGSFREAFYGIADELGLIKAFQMEETRFATPLSAMGMEFIPNPDGFTRIVPTLAPGLYVQAAHPQLWDEEAQRHPDSQMRDENNKRHRQAQLFLDPRCIALKANASLDFIRYSEAADDL